MLDTRVPVPGAVPVGGRRLPNVLGSPHNSSIVPGTMLDAARQAIEHAVAVTCLICCADHAARSGSHINRLAGPGWAVWCNAIGAVTVSVTEMSILACLSARPCPVRPDAIGLPSAGCCPPGDRDARMGLRP